MLFLSDDRTEAVPIGDNSIDLRAGQNPACSERMAWTKF